MRTVGTTPSFGTTTEGTGCPGWLACVASPLVTSRGQPPRKEAMPYNVGIDREEFARLWSEGVPNYRIAEHFGIHSNTVLRLACEQARRLSLMAHVVDVYSVKRGFNGAVYLNTE